MKVIIKGRLSEEYLKYAADKVAEIFEQHPPTDEEFIAKHRANHLRIVAMVDELGIVGKEARQAMYDQIFDREEDEQIMQRWTEAYWEGERVVCDIGDVYQNK